MNIRGYATAFVMAALLVACGGQPEIPDVVGEDLSFARGALGSAELEHEVEEVDVDDPDEDGLVQDTRYEEGTVIVEVGTLPMITLTGEFTLTADPAFPSMTSVDEDDSCSGSGGYSDFGTGMNVTIRDGDGNIVGSTSTDRAEYVSTGSTEALYCQTGFETDVDIVDFYAIGIGSRGELTYSFEDLEDQDFNLSLTLGD